MFEGSNIHLSPVDGKKLCSFSQKICKQHRLNGYAFCIRHILEDPNSPFKQCQYTMKSSKEQCCNAVPVSEDRIYCNSHLQVLGILPKTIPKKPLKKFSEPLKSSKGGGGNLKNTKNNIIKKIKNQKFQKKKRSQLLLLNKKMKKKTITRLSNPKTVQNQQMNDQFWQTTVKENLKSIEMRNEKWGKKKLHENLEEFRKIKSKEPDGYLLGVHKICDESDNESDDGKYLYQSELAIAPERAYHNDLHTDNVLTQERKVLSKLRHQHAQLKQAFVAKKSRSDLSYSKLKHLIAAAKQDPVETANIINISKNAKTCPAFRNEDNRYSYKIPCCIVNKKSRCSNYAVPYTKYCIKHILHDEEQLLYFKPSPINVKTPTQAYGVTYTFLCNTTPKMVAKKKVKASKDSRLTADNEKKNNKQLSDESEQSSFNESISEKTTSDGYSSGDSDTSDDETTPEEAFHLPSGTLSSLYPGLNQIDEDSLSALQSRNMNFEDDEDEELMQCSTKSFNSSNAVSRDLSSPTLNQLSSSNFDNTIFLSQSNKSVSLSSRANPIGAIFPPYPDNDCQSNDEETDDNDTAMIKKTMNKKVPDDPIEKVNPDIFFSSAFPVPNKKDVSQL